MHKEMIKIAEATLSILSKKSWDSISTEDVLKKTKLKKNNAIKKISNKKDLLSNINRFIDNKIKNNLKTLEQSSQKDMIFEILMMRFEILEKYRKSIINIFISFKKKPHELIFLLPSFIESMILMANLSNITTNGVKGNIKVKSLLIIYFSSFLIWIEDTNSELEKTMTSLDSYLDKANDLLKIFKD